jgi:predicted amidophosphoribosyltransferase
VGVRDAFVDLVLGSVCAGCGEPGPAVCSDCRDGLRNAIPVEAWPDPVPIGLPRPMAATQYGGVVRKLILAHKEEAQYALARPLGELLALAVRSAMTGRAAWIAPVPSAAGTVRRRGHDPLRRVARLAVKELRGQGYDVRLADALVVVRRPADQAGLTAGERAANLAGAFGVRSRWAERLTDQPILLVDDVLTTGSTLAEAARALAEHRIPVPGCAVVAATGRTAASGS